MKHLTPDELSAMLDGRLAPDKAVLAEVHLETCRECRDAFAEASAREEALGRALEHDPGEAYFESFAERVDARIAESGRRPARSGPPLLGALFEWLGVPRNLATAGAALAIVVGVGTTLIVAQQTNQQVMKNEKLAARMEQRGGAAAVPPPGPNAPKESEAGRRQRELDAAAEPGATLGLSEEAAKMAREFRAREREGGAKTEPAPTRAQEVQRNALGDDEPVRAEAPAPAAATESRDADARATDNVKSALRAQPLSGAARESRFASAARLCGDVRDAGGRPLRFASVTVAGTGSGAQTDEHGRFCVPVSPGRDSLVVQLVGFQTLRTAVNLTSSASQEIRLTLAPMRGLASSVRSTRAARGDRSEETKAGAVLTPAALPDSLRDVAELAERLSGVAARSGDARQHEAAAVQWERLLAAVAGQPLEVAVRGRIADERYLAWEADPDARRAQAAREALTAYLVRAPIGPERSRATLRLDKVAR